MRAAAGPRPGADPRAAGDPRFGDERGATGRLGPPPGLAGDYQPGSGVSSGSAADWGDRTERIDRVNPGRAASGPMAGYAPSGGARPGTGPMAARPGTGPISAWSSQAGYAPSTTGPRPSFQPGSGPAASRPAGGRPSDRAADWGERTERIDRVDAAGYPEPRPNGRVQAPGRPSTPTAGATSGPFGATAAPGTVGRGRIDNGRGDNSRIDNSRIDNSRSTTAGQTTDGSTARTGERRTAASWVVRPTANPAVPPGAGPGPAAAPFPAPTGPATALVPTTP